MRRRTFGLHCYRMMPLKHWNASQMPRAPATAASFEVWPVAMRCVMELKSQVTSVKTAPPTSARIQALATVAKPAAKGSRPKVTTARGTAMR